MRTIILFFIVLLSINCTCFAQQSSKKDSIPATIAWEDNIQNPDNQEFLEESGLNTLFISKRKLQKLFCKRYYSTLQSSTKRWYNKHK